MSRFLIDLAVRLLPPHRKAWGDAMRAEFSAIPGRREALDFAAGCLWTALSERLTVMKLIAATGRFGVGIVTLLTGAWFLHGLPNIVMIMLGRQPDPFHDMLVRHHHVQSAADHVHAYPYMLAFAVLMGVGYTGAGIFLIRWRPKPFAAFCALAAIPAVGMSLAGALHNISGPMSYAWPFVPLALLVTAAVFFHWLGRDKRTPPFKGELDLRT